MLIFANLVSSQRGSEMRSSYRSLFSAKRAQNTSDMIKDNSITLNKLDYSNNFESSQFPLKELQRSLSKKVHKVFQL